MARSGLPNQLRQAKLTQSQSGHVLVGHCGTRMLALGFSFLLITNFDKGGEGSLWALFLQVFLMCRGSGTVIG